MIHSRGDRLKDLFGKSSRLMRPKRHLSTFVCGITGTWHFVQGDEATTSPCLTEDHRALCGVTRCPLLLLALPQNGIKVQDFPTNFHRALVCCFDRTVLNTS